MLIDIETSLLWLWQIYEFYTFWQENNEYIREFFTQLSMAVNEKVRFDTSAYVYSAYTTVLSMKTGYISPLLTRERCAFNVNQSQKRAVWAVAVLRPPEIQ